ncbi:hypothetical protein EST38_g5369 [Candolleomyces aberdarensis]|uniref:Uncharacterized protein n=1 Tax=Candolleomyces aberdarensis TaxID=2316362 RepID=A0A4Q2DMC8_9AGAR|nr:hypothetical protein EST38_g5369 [Candolleomyces aberdarensis]
MQRGNFPDLDLPDSPLLSATIPAGLGPVPGSALAERIFNDPDAWETEDFGEDMLSDPMAWFTEELERFRLNSAASSDTAFSSGTDDEGASSDAELDKVTFMPSPGLTVQGSLVKGIKRKSLRPISLAALFKHSGEDLPKDVQAQLANIIESGGLPLTVGKGLPSTTTSSSSATLSSAATEMSSQPSPSPVVVHSASATLSFLEWYGIYPDSPLRDISFRKSIYANSRKPKTPGPHLHIPSPKAAQSRPSSLLSPSVLIPDLRVEPPKRGSSVPPLESLKPMLDQVVQAAKASPPPADSRSSSPPNPPGLSQSPPPVVTEELKPTPNEAPKAPLEDAPANANADAQTHTPASTPPKVRQNSAERRRPVNIRTTDSPPPYSRVDTTASPRRLPTSTASSSERPTPTSTPVRRLPSIPSALISGRSTTPPAPQQPSTAVPSTSTGIFSPLPSSLPTASSLLSPEPPLTSQTITFHGRPMSAVRSPLGGPAGPRSRASNGGRSISGPRISSSLARRPPVLQL